MGLLSEDAGLVGGSRLERALHEIPAGLDQRLSNGPPIGGRIC
ncbi:MAG: hypothetical protein R3A44_39215 [Caldilineaceae bacterium]